MKLKREDNVVVILGRDKGKTGKVTMVIPAENKVVVEGINIVKRHTKPSSKNPRGGILELTKPINASKVMALDPASGLPARIGYSVKPDGTKERVFKVSANQKSKPKAKSAAKAAKTASTDQAATAAKVEKTGEK